MTRILVVGPAWVGDMVMAQSLVAELRRRDPAATIDLLAPPFTAPLGARMPGVGRTLVIDTAHGRFDLLKRIRVGWGLRGAAYDLAIVLPSSWKSAIVPFFAGVRRRRGYVGEWRYGLLNDLRQLDEQKVERTVDRFTALAGARDEAPRPATAAPVLVADHERGRALAGRLGLSADDRAVVGLCPGAEYGPAKQWPAEAFGALAQRLARTGYRTWIFGSPKDAGIGETIRALAGTPAAPVNLAGKTDLIEAIDLMSLTAGVVTNDSGLMHIAAAIGRPLVALYGSTTPEMTPPLARDVTILERTLPCRPCFQRVCPLGHLNCLKLIDAEEVAAAVTALVRSDPAQASDAGPSLPLGSPVAR
jgi:heptosyltransferase-2